MKYEEQLLETFLTSSARKQTTDDREAVARFLADFEPAEDYEDEELKKLEEAEAIRTALIDYDQHLSEMNGISRKESEKSVDHYLKNYAPNYEPSELKKIADEMLDALNKMERPAPKRDIETTALAVLSLTKEINFKHLKTYHEQHQAIIHVLKEKS